MTHTLFSYGSIDDDDVTNVSADVNVHWSTTGDYAIKR